MNATENNSDRVHHRERRVFDLTSLLTAGRALHNILVPDDLYKVLIAMVAEKLDAGPMALFVYDKEDKICRLVRCHGLPEFGDSEIDIRFEEGLLWQNVLQYEPFPVTSASGEALFERFFQQHGRDRIVSCSV